MANNSTSNTATPAIENRHLIFLFDQIDAGKVKMEAQLTDYIKPPAALYISAEANGVDPWALSETRAEFIPKNTKITMKRNALAFCKQILGHFPVVYQDGKGFLLPTTQMMDTCREYLHRVEPTALRFYKETDHDVDGISIESAFLSPRLVIAFETYKKEWNAEGKSTEPYPGTYNMFEGVSSKHVKQLLEINDQLLDELKRVMFFFNLKMEP